MKYFIFCLHFISLTKISTGNILVVISIALFFSLIFFFFWGGGSEINLILNFSSKKKKKKKNTIYPEPATVVNRLLHDVSVVVLLCKPDAEVCRLLIHVVQICLRISVISVYIHCYIYPFFSFLIFEYCFFKLLFISLYM